MSAPQNFGDLGNQLQNIVVQVLSNENIAKLLTYTESDNDPLSKPVVADPFGLKNTRLFTQSYRPPTDTAGVFLCILMDDFKKANNIYFKWNTIKFMVIVHRDLWEISGNLRAFAIMHELDSLVNMERLQGMGKNWFKRCNYYTYNDLYNGYIIEYSGYDFS